MHTLRPKRAGARKPLKSSVAARRLIRVVVKRHGSQRKAAYALRLPNQAVLNRILHGKIRDTFEMKAALSRADERARRAWELAPMPAEAVVDKSSIRVAIHELETTVTNLKRLIGDQP